MSEAQGYFTTRTKVPVYPSEESTESFAIIETLGSQVEAVEIHAERTHIVFPFDGWIETQDIAIG